ncbi:MAG: ATP synthase F1 subunit gamma [Chloroflexia bacterium]|nr:ATP synthase F1 subunit gamma [Chloroflexia bacterium]
MSTVREIRRRIRSVKNMAQITKAMEAVSASKMRRAQANVLASRPYSKRMWEVINDLVDRHTPVNGEPMHALLAPRETIRSVALVLITADRGLCGSYNVEIIREAVRFIREQGQKGIQIRVLAVGQRGRDYMLRLGVEVESELTRLSDQPSLLDTVPISWSLIEGYQSGRFDAVYIAYTDFINVLTREPQLAPLLPLTTFSEAREGGKVDYIYEPDPKAVLSQLLPRFVEVEVYQYILESLASEHSARMVSMRNATENADELVQDLTLSYNKVRQASITKEITELTGGAAALEQQD